MTLRQPGHVRQRTAGRAHDRGTTYLPAAVGHNMVNVLANEVATQLQAPTKDGPLELLGRKVAAEHANALGGKGREDQVCATVRRSSTGRPHKGAS